MCICVFCFAFEHSHGTQLALMLWLVSASMVARIPCVPLHPHLIDKPIKERLSRDVWCTGEATPPPRPSAPVELLAEESRQEGQIASPISLSPGHARTTCLKGSRKTTQEQGGCSKGRTLILQRRWNQGGSH